MKNFKKRKRGKHILNVQSMLIIISDIYKEIGGSFEKRTFSTSGKHGAFTLRNS